MAKIANGKHSEGRKWLTEPYPVLFFQHEVWMISYVKNL
jgi:hypothetical protein